MAKTPTSKQDRAHGDLRDTRKGAYDPVGNQKVPDKNHQTEHERAQTGADVRGEPVPTQNFEVPEGLKRQRKGPYDRVRGRGDVPAHVPGPKGSIRGH